MCKVVARCSSIDSFGSCNVTTITDVLFSFVIFVCLWFCRNLKNSNSYVNLNSISSILALIGKKFKIQYFVETLFYYLFTCLENEYVDNYETLLLHLTVSIPAEVCDDLPTEPHMKYLNSPLNFEFGVYYYRLHCTGQYFSYDKEINLKLYAKTYVALNISTRRLWQNLKYIGIHGCNK